MMKITGSCELHASATSMVSLLPVNAAGRQRAATMLFVFPLLTMLVPSAAGLAGCERSLALNGPWKALGLTGQSSPGRRGASWTDLIRRGRSCCFRAGTEFPAASRQSGELAVWPGDRPRWGRSACGSIRFLLLSEGLGGNTVSPDSTTA